MLSNNDDELFWVEKTAKIIGVICLIMVVVYFLIKIIVTRQHLKDKKCAKNKRGIFKLLKEKDHTKNKEGVESIIRIAKRWHIYPLKEVHMEVKPSDQKKGACDHQ